ncbi:MAG: pyridoxal phosphate-dependent aminotransferase [Promethearchaeota archaeon]
MKKTSDAINRIPPDEVGPFAVLRKAQKLESEGRKILHFEIGQPDYQCPNHISEAGIQAIRDGFTKYVQTAGIPEFKEAIQDEIEKTRGFRPTQDQIVVFPGGNTAIFYVLAATLNPGDEVIYPSPSFPTYGLTAYYLNAKHVMLPVKEENGFRLNPGDILDRITDKTKLIIINSPQNPTGAVTNKKEIQEIAEIAEEKDIFLLTDEIYSKMLYDETHYSASVQDSSKERTILLDGMAKAYAMTGWRLGYTVAPANVAKKMSELIVASFSCVPAFIQKAGIAALKGDQSFIKRNMELYRKRRDVMVSGLNSIPGFHCTVPQGAFYAFPNITGTGKTSIELGDILLNEAGVACLPGPAFGPYGEGFLRFSYATTIETINEAIEAIKRVIS